MTLPTPSGNPNTQFNLGDLTFNDSAGRLFITGGLGTSSSNFFYEYSLNGTGTPTLVASRIWTDSKSDPSDNGIIFDQGTGVLYGYSDETGHMYTIDTTTLTIASDIGSNSYLLQAGDLAGALTVPEPSGITSMSVGVLFVLACWRIWKRTRQTYTQMLKCI